MQKTARLIKPRVSIVPVQPTEVAKYWLLAEFMVKEALKYSGQYADSKHIYDLLLTDQMQMFIMFGNDVYLGQTWLGKSIKKMGMGEKTRTTGKGS